MSFKAFPQDSVVTERNRCRHRGRSVRLLLCVQLVDSVESVKEAKEAAGHGHTHRHARAHTHTDRVLQLTKGCSRRLIKAVADGHAGNS